MREGKGRSQKQGHCCHAEVRLENCSRTWAHVKRRPHTKTCVGTKNINSNAETKILHGVNQLIGCLLIEEKGNASPRLVQGVHWDPVYSYLLPSSPVTKIPSCGDVSPSPTAVHNTNRGPVPWEFTLGSLWTCRACLQSNKWRPVGRSPDNFKAAMLEGLHPTWRIAPP